MYGLDLEGERAECLAGPGPREVSADMVREFLKYDSGLPCPAPPCRQAADGGWGAGGKCFQPLETRQFGSTTDAVVLHPTAFKPARKPQW